MTIFWHNTSNHTVSLTRTSESWNSSKYDAKTPYFLARVFMCMTYALFICNACGKVWRVPLEEGGNPDTILGTVGERIRSCFTYVRSNLANREHLSIIAPCAYTLCILWYPQEPSIVLFPLKTMPAPNKEANECDHSCEKRPEINAVRCVLRNCSWFTEFLFLFLFPDFDLHCETSLIRAWIHEAKRRAWGFALALS